METPTNLIRSRFVIGFFGGLAALMLMWIVVAAFSQNEWATIQQGDSDIYMVRVADNPLERARGLAQTDPSALGDAIGMLFVFGDTEPHTFTMKGMRYGLDFLWIKEGKIVQIDRNVPAPADGEDPLTVTTYPISVDMVIELPAGMAAQLQYLVGHELTINLNPE